MTTTSKATLGNALDLAGKISFIELGDARGNYFTRYDYCLEDGDLVLLENDDPVEWISLDTEVKLTGKGIEFKYEEDGGRGKKIRGVIKFARTEYVDMTEVLGK